MNVFHRLRWLILAYWIAFVYTIREWFTRTFSIGHNLRNKELCPQAGHNAIVTGGSRGIGFEVVKYLLELGCNVIIGSSSSTEERTKLENFLTDKYPSANVQVWHLDLASLDSVAEFAQKFLTSEKPLHLLINNAGVMFVTPRQVTKDGFERQFAINYLSHCLLSFLLLPAMTSHEQSYNPRITNSSSCIHHVSDLDLNDLQGKAYSKHHAYMQSKLTQVMFTYTFQSYLDKKGINVKVNCAHPGVTNTELMTKELLITCLAPIWFKTAKQGAETIIYATVSKEMEDVGGKYLEDCAVADSSKISRDTTLQSALWKESLLLLKPWLEEQLYKDLFNYG